MNKLLKLLNEYSSLNWLYYLEGMFFHDVEKDVPHLHYTAIISKEYGFIKWLVDNDKIDKFYYENSVRVKRYIDEYDEYDYVFPMDYEQLIMLLSIEDNPIDFLISILK